MVEVEIQLFEHRLVDFVRSFGMRGGRGLFASRVHSQDVLVLAAPVFLPVFRGEIVVVVETEAGAVDFPGQYPVGENESDREYE